MAGFRRPPRDVDSMTSLRVGNLPYRLDWYGGRIDTMWSGKNNNNIYTKHIFSTLRWITSLLTPCLINFKHQMKCLYKCLGDFLETKFWIPPPLCQFCTMDIMGHVVAASCPLTLSSCSARPRICLISTLKEGMMVHTERTIIGSP